MPDKSPTPWTSPKVWAGLPSLPRVWAPCPSPAYTGCGGASRRPHGPPSLNPPNSGGPATVAKSFRWARSIFIFRPSRSAFLQRPREAEFLALSHEASRSCDRDQIPGRSGLRSSNHTPPPHLLGHRSGGQRPAKPTYSPAREGGSLAGSCWHWCSRVREAGEWGHSMPRRISPF